MRKRSEDAIVGVLKAQIERYEKKKKLPAEDDILDENSPKLRREEYNEYPALENRDYPTAFQSGDADLLAACEKRFTWGLSDQERLCYSLTMVGGLSRVEAQGVMHVSKQRMAQLVKNVREKARRAINMQKLRESQEETK